MRVDGCVKNFVNLWFRHIGFLVYPIGIMIVLASILTGVPIFEILLYLVPVFFVALIIGYFLDIGFVRVNFRGDGGSRDFKFFVEYFSPLLASIIFACLLHTSFGTAIAVLIGILIIFSSSGFRFSMLLSAVWRSRFYNVAFASIMIMLFREVLNVSGGIALLSYGFPRIIVYTFIPFISGFLTGSPIGALAFSLSIALALNSFFPPGWLV